MCSKNHSEKLEDGNSQQRAELVVSIHTRGVVYSRLRCITTLSPSLPQAASLAVEGAIAKGHRAVEVHTSYYVVNGMRGGGRETEL